MSAPRPTLLMPLFHPNLDVIHNGWLGGVIFVQNLVRLLSDLRDTERPRVLVLTDAEPASDFVKTMTAFDAVEGVFKPSGEAVVVKEALHPLVTVNGAIDNTRVTQMFTDAATLFPACQALFHPYKALHWIPDLQHKYLPHLFEAEELRQRDYEFDRMLHKQRFVLVSSHAAADDVARFYPNPTAKIYVWPFVSGVTSDAPVGPDPRVTYQLPEKYLFAPNQFWIHKDHLTLFKAIKLLADQGQQITVVCTGSRGDARKPTHFADLARYVQDNGIAHLIKYLGIVDHATLTNLFRYATAVAQPSLFEGWSTVVEDTKSIGRPIFLTDLPVHYEQATTPNPFYFFRQGDAAHLAEQLSAHWPNLTPGPDADAETAGHLARAARARTAARAFIGIMNDMAAITAAETQNRSAP
ncbi:MAG: glycosyltransferase [Rhodospirillaceae bacterium]|nr:glycosyltransferase [Rhodospirillaceae bacterium]